MIIEGLVDNTLYHYTDLDAFINIINNNELWLTHYADVEDTKEIKFGYEIIQSELNKRFSALLDNKLSGIIFNVHKIMPEQYFFCTCPDKENEHLWKNYANNHSGVAIGFDAEFFARKFTPSKLFSTVANITPVNYDLENFREIVIQEVSKLKIPAFYVVNVPNTAEQLNRIPYYAETKEGIISCCVKALLLKAPIYSIENETRLLHDIRMHIPILIEERYGKRRAILRFEKLPIKAVILGKNMPKKSVSIIEKALCDNKLDIKVYYGA